MVIQFPQRDRPFYANYRGCGADVIHLPPVYPLPPGERARQLRRWFNRRKAWYDLKEWVETPVVIGVDFAKPEPIVAADNGVVTIEFRD